MDLKILTMQAWEIASVRKGNWIPTKHVNAHPLLFHSQVELSVTLKTRELNSEELVTSRIVGNYVK